MQIMANVAMENIKIHRSILKKKTKIQKIHRSIKRVSEDENDQKSDRKTKVIAIQMKYPFTVLTKFAFLFIFLSE